MSAGEQCALRPQRRRFDYCYKFSQPISGLFMYKSPGA